MKNHSLANYMNNLWAYYVGNPTDSQKESNMKFILLKTVLMGAVLSLSCLVNLANAELIDTDNDSFIDTETGLEWMDFGINNHQTYNYVVSQLGEGGIYEGWVLPTTNQVEDMWFDALVYSDNDEMLYGRSGPDTWATWDGSGEVGSNFSDLLQVMGSTKIEDMGNGQVKHESWGLYNGDNGITWVNYSVYTAEGRTRQDAGGLERDQGTFEGYRASDNALYHSTMLVRAEDVPAPPALAIFALGVIGLGIRRLKKQHISQVTA